jgi:hypothetical protein
MAGINAVRRRLEFFIPRYQKQSSLLAELARKLWHTFVLGFNEKKKTVDNLLAFVSICWVCEHCIIAD